MRKPRNILVPVDLSPISIQGLQTAKRLARSLGARVHVVHVSPPVPQSALMAAAIAWHETPSSVAKAVREGLLVELKDLASKCALSSNDKIYSRDGAPVFDVICRLAAEIPADLVVVPTRGFKGVKRFFLGSTAERLIQHSPCPVLVDRKSGAPFSPNDSLSARRELRIDKILVPVDFSKCSREGLRYAIEFARKFAATITVLHVLDLGYSEPKDVHILEHWKGSPGASARQVLNEVRQEMSKFLRSVSFGRVKANREIAIGPPIRYVSDFAFTNDFDLIITSTHGRTGFKHVLIGSIAERLVRQTRVPILVVPSHPEARTPSGGARQKKPGF